MINNFHEGLNFNGFIYNHGCFLHIIEAPIPDQDPIGNLKGTVISIGLEPTMPRHMSWFRVLQRGGMSNYDKLRTLVIHLNRLLTSKIHSNFNLGYKITENFANLLISIFLHGNKLHRLILLQIWRKIS